MAMTVAEIWEHQRYERAWSETEVGGLFLRYENATARAWQIDSSETASGRRMREAWEVANAARQALLAVMRRDWTPPSSAEPADATNNGMTP